ncbi:MAG: hypothetical protein RBS38_02335 [Bacteroidales bacterium]|jgi:hypothetical protein|nr:hypothetical protein [Bacteroidales bacterium]
MSIKDEAFKWLVYEPLHSTVAWAAIIDDVELLHGDPRWNEFLNRVNLSGENDLNYITLR